MQELLNNATQAPRAPIIIDGCFVPFEVYDRVKALAISSGQCQFIGVIYNHPGRLSTRPGLAGLLSEDFERKVDFCTGQHLVYVVDQKREYLRERSDIAMILWITPREDC